MTVDFTAHALDQLYRWRLSEAAVLDVIQNPDRVTHDDRSRAWQWTGTRWLRVTYLEGDGEPLVITVALLRQGPEGEDNAHHL